jgi:lipoate---protein ligase
MLEKWRLLNTSPRNAFYNMALDEAIVIAKSQNLVPNTLRFFRWKPSAVSIGYFQSMDEEINTEACKNRSIDCVRRRTGGGAVFHDENGELTYSLIMGESHRLITKDFQNTYKTLCSGLVLGLENLGLPARFKPINDIEVEGKKISGNAQTRGLNIVHQHGTILREVDVNLMFEILRVPNEKIKDKMIKAVQERVTSVNSYLKREVTFEELCHALIRGFSEAFKIELTLGNITKHEEKLAGELEAKKYATEKWNLKR